MHVILRHIHCVRRVQIRSYFWSEYSKYGTEITPYLELFCAIIAKQN